jgi:hypothetical protein
VRVISKLLFTHTIISCIGSRICILGNLILFVLFIIINEQHAMVEQQDLTMFDLKTICIQLISKTPSNAHKGSSQDRIFDVVEILCSKTTLEIKLSIVLYT